MRCHREHHILVCPLFARGAHRAGAVQTQHSMRVLELLGVLREGDLPELRKLLLPAAQAHSARGHRGHGKARKKAATSTLQRGVVGSLHQLAKFKWFPPGTKIQVRSSTCEYRRTANYWSRWT